MPALGKAGGDLPRVLLGPALEFATEPGDDDRQFHSTARRVADHCEVLRTVEQLTDAG